MNADFEQRSLAFARASQDKALIALIAGILGAVGIHWINYAVSPTVTRLPFESTAWTVAVSVVLAGLGVLMQSRLFLRLGLCGIFHSTDVRVVARSPIHARDLIVRYVKFGGALLIEAAIITFAARLVFTYGQAQLGSRGTALDVLEIVLWIFYANAAIAGLVAVCLLAVGLLTTVGKRT